jgi:hypothetical protein
LFGGAQKLVWVRTHWAGVAVPMRESNNGRLRGRVWVALTGGGDAIETRRPGPVAYTYRLLRQLLRDGQVDAAALVFKDFAEVPVAGREVRR